MSLFEDVGLLSLGCHTLRRPLCLLGENVTLFGFMQAYNVKITFMLDPQPFFRPGCLHSAFSAAMKKTYVEVKINNLN